jgi:hypothetical protein
VVPTLLLFIVLGLKIERLWRIGTSKFENFMAADMLLVSDNPLEIWIALRNKSNGSESSIYPGAAVTVHRQVANQCTSQERDIDTRARTLHVQDVVHELPWDLHEV